MAPKKLSDADRQEILKRYRQPEENTVTIANSYGVSTSTVSRILKQNLSEAEYESLIQQKRSGTHRFIVEQPVIGQPIIEQPIIEQPVIEQPIIEQADLPGIVPQAEFPVSLVPETAEPQRHESKPVIPPPRRRQRKRSDEPDTMDAFVSDPESAQLELTSVTPGLAYEQDDVSQPASFGGSIPVIDKPVIEKSELEEIEAELGKSSLAPAVELEDDLEDEDLEDEDLEDEDLEDEDLDEDADLDEEELSPHSRGFSTVQIQKGGLLQVLPLSDAAIPKTCYVVVDRSSELITRPLKDFADLGQIPEAEIQSKTLPIFDNHRVAKRFTRRMQRVVKVPDGRMLQKVRPYLQAKGITRLLIDGQVYSL